MHELGLCSSIVEAVAGHAAGRRVLKVTVRVGRLHHVHPDAFEQSFAVAAQGTVAEGAQAELFLLPLTSRCRACASSHEGTSLPLACASCGSTNVAPVGGDELVLESIEYAG